MDWVDIKIRRPNHGQEIVAYGDIECQVHGYGKGIFCGYCDVSGPELIVYSDLGQALNITHWYPAERPEINTTP